MPEADRLQHDAQALLALKEKLSARHGGERCELCSSSVHDVHSHLIDIVEHRIVCSCEACALLFDDRAGLRYKRIPRDVVQLNDSAVDDMAWSSLSIPIGLAFFFFSSRAGKMMAVYPSPAGATESLLELETWKDIAQRHPRLQQLRPDVEALLVNRLRAPGHCYIVPIDRCYELAGTVRKYWTGFSGGDAVWREVDGFFRRLCQQCSSPGAEHARP